MITIAYIGELSPGSQQQLSSATQSRSYPSMLINVLHHQFRNSNLCPDKPETTGGDSLIALFFLKPLRLGFFCVRTSHNLGGFSKSFFLFEKKGEERKIFDFFHWPPCLVSIFHPLGILSRLLDAISSLPCCVVITSDSGNLLCSGSSRRILWTNRER
ncbi:hypothetical protein AVEN_4508-1 [Araneus ventricosus]|uniref:Uncharacterized protein n=1 Tax=Araneus ventricosus TaxID=182803 RepID=A0A4Y2BM60_ARAVE|nr:hypothetical protein AVEN_4508-1 [Araneus ventricosus]